MCNRFRSIHEWSQLPRDLRGSTLFNFESNPNIAPTELVPIILADRKTQLARFGITKIGRPPLLNARTDGMRSGQFRTHLAERRCIIPCDGFYEWRDEDGKQPYYFHRKDGAPLMLAGIWEESEYKGDRRIAFAILTDEPNDLIAAYHDRMPLALADGKIESWLTFDVKPWEENLLLDLGEFAVRSMNRAMNSVRMKDAAAIELPSA